MVASSSLCVFQLNLPIEEIFLRLPTKLIVQCKSVCKEWYGIISSPSFIDMHFNRHTNQTSLLLYYNKYYFDLAGVNELSCYSLFHDFQTLERHQVPDHLVLHGEITFLRGPCNGLFCIHVRENRFALWNPTTRMFRPILCSPSYKFDEVGFGVDPLTGDYKIVLIRTLVRVSPCFAIYTSSNDSWRYLEQESLGDWCAYLPKDTSGRYTFLNGTYYWILHRGAGVVVLSFDMHNEIFEQIGAPDIIGGLWGGLLDLFDNSLALFSTKKSCMEIWLLEGNEYWIQILNVVLPFPSFVHGFCGGNKILLDVPDRDKGFSLMMYDLDSHNIQLLNIDKGPDEKLLVHLPIHYKECLASVKGEHGIEVLDTRSVAGLKFLGYEGEGLHTKIGCDFHRQDAQLGTEEQQYFRDIYEDCDCYLNEPAMEDYDPYPDGEW